MSTANSMHFWTEEPVLFVEEDNITKIDPRKPENLFGMWSVFAKASGIIENGKRLENMSWRLWQQQTLCPKLKRKSRPSATSSTRPQLDQPNSQSQSSIPALSSSVESGCSSNSERGNCSHASCPRRRVSCALSENEVTSIDLQNLMLSIKEKQDLTGPLSPLPSSPIMEGQSTKLTQQENAPAPQTSPTRPATVESSTSTIESMQTDSTCLSPTDASETSQESGSENSTHSVVRGFKPGGISTYRSQSQLASLPAPILKTSTEENRIPVTRNKGQLFQLGGSSGDEDGSMKDRLSTRSRGSSLRTVHEGSSSAKKQTSFVDHVTEIGPKKSKAFIFDDDEDTGAIESDSEDDEGDEEAISESAIDDDDDDDDDDDAWVDDAEPEEQPKLTFPRVESKPDLVSRRSMLTANLHQDQRAAAMQAAAVKSSPLLRRSRTSTPNGPSMPASPTEDSLIKFREGASNGETRQEPLNPQMISVALAPANIQQPPPPMSPRAARRNMVNQELGVSLRKAMLNERQYKNLYAQNSAIRRAHTSVDVTKLNMPQSQIVTRSEDGTKIYPISKKENKTSSWNEDFDHDLSDYHRKGW